jgi:hypothetical protein
VNGKGREVVHFYYNVEEVYTTAELTYFLNIDPPPLFFATTYYAYFSSLQIWIDFTKVVPPQTGLSYCFVIIVSPICADGKFMVVLLSVFNLLPPEFYI